MQFDGKHVRIALEIGVSGKDGPIMIQGHGANQGVNNGHHNSFVLALIARLGGKFIVRRIHHDVHERAEVKAKFIELSWIANARQHFLPDQPYETDPAFIDQL